MSKLDLNEYSDREIVTAFFKMSAEKFIPVTQALGGITERMIKRGKNISQDSSDEVVENMIRRLFDGEVGPEE